MKSFLRKSKGLRGLRDDLQAFRLVYLSGRQRAVSAYLATATTPALHLGANKSRLPGWLETDIEPPSRAVTYLDATKPFPAPAQSFMFIYAEHMIEHIPYAAGLAMLKECRRVLKQNGVLRVATPDLAVILNLYNNSGVAEQDYMNWISSRFLGKPHAEGSTFIINNAFRSWGHQFLYDRAVLESLLRAAGFESVSWVEYNQSSHDMLRNIEQHGKNVGSDKMAIYESMICEAS